MSGVRSCDRHSTLFPIEGECSICRTESVTQCTLTGVEHEVYTAVTAYEDRVRTEEIVAAAATACLECTSLSDALEDSASDYENLEESRDYWEREARYLQRCLFLMETDMAKVREAVGTLTFDKILVEGSNIIDTGDTDE